VLKNYLKTAWRNIIRNKSYSYINIGGLGIAIAACLLIGLFVNHEISFDNYIKDRNNIYRLNEYMHYDGMNPQLSAAISPPIGPLLKNEASEIERFTRVFPASPAIYPSVTILYNKKKFSVDDIACADTSFADIFNIKIGEGEKDRFLQSQNSIVLTQSLASKIFGEEPALNKMLALSTGDSTVTYFSVSNVIKDMPENSHLQVSALIPVPQNMRYGNNFGVLVGPTYLKLRPGTDVKKMETKLTDLLHEKFKYLDMRLQPVSEVHSGSMNINYDYYNYNKTDRKYFRIFIIIALAVFIVACVNFINLSTVASVYRGKEIIMKKISGASRSQLVLQILLETFLAVLFAILLAIILASIFFPYINNILHRNLETDLLFTPGVIVFSIIVLLATTLLAGFYPAWLISSAKINKVLRNKILIGSSKNVVRNILVTGQFALATVFIVSLLVISRQLKFIKSKDLGYFYDQTIKIPLDQQTATKLPVLRAELSQIKGVENVTNGYFELGSSSALMGVDYIAPDGTAQQISTNFENAGPGFINFFGIKILQGSNFSKAGNMNEYLVNEALAKQMGYKNPIGKEINLTSWPKGIITGVVKDYNYSSLHSKVEPLIIGNIDQPFFQTQLYIKLSTADLSASLTNMQKSIKSISGNDNLRFVFLEDTFKALYNSETQAENLIAIIGSLAVIIACLGLLSLSAFMIIKRTKEISVRKILGASVQTIVLMLSSNFLRLAGIAFIIGFPVAWWAMHAWLQDFAYRTNIGASVFLIAAAAICGVVFLTISYQSIKTAIANPVESLRTE